MSSTSGAPGGRSSPGRGPERALPFGKYVLLERVSVGGMAEVFRAKAFGAEGFERILAIKRILPTMSEDAEFIEMFIDEARIAGQLTHANIVPLYELGKLGDTHYIAMEYVWGKDLLQVMNRFRRQRKHMPPVMVAWIASKMAGALAYAHEKTDSAGRPLHIVHRDVSPQNVLISYEGHVKVIDFGIAKAASRNTKTQAGVLKGKFGYMSPEQVRGNEVDARSDLFAVGTCMHEMATGERLFLGESDFSTLERVRNAEVLPPSRYIPDFPRELEVILMRALSLDVGSRWQSAAELHDALLGFLQTQRPLYGTSKLAGWMKASFAQEIETEKARAAGFQNVGRPSPPAARERRDTLPALSDAAPEVEDTDHDPPGRAADLEDDKTIVGEPGFDSAPPEPPTLPDQPTHIFFSTEEMALLPSASWNPPGEAERSSSSRPPPIAESTAPPRPSHPTLPLSTLGSLPRPPEAPAILGGFDAASLFPPPAFVPRAAEKPPINIAKVVFFVLLGITALSAVLVFFLRPQVPEIRPIEPEVADLGRAEGQASVTPRVVVDAGLRDVSVDVLKVTDALPDQVHDASAQKSGLDAASRDARETTVPAKPPARAQHGDLVISTIPWARVYIDGRDIHRNTPVPSLRVRAGLHRIGLRTPDGQLHSETVDVRPNETTRLIRRF